MMLGSDAECLAMSTIKVDMDLPMKLMCEKCMRYKYRYGF